VKPSTLTPLLLVVAAALGAGCGGDEETKPSIPPQNAQELQSRLDEVERRFDAGDGACDDIVNDSQPAVESILASMPSSVDPDVRSALNESFDHLFELSAEQCKGDEETTTPTETVTETTETQTTETTETTPTETIPTETTPTETTPTETIPTTPGEGDGGGAGAEP
jgi:hypothetical protein